MREHGHEPPPKGRLPAEWRAMAEDIRSVITAAAEPALVSDGVPGHEPAEVAESSHSESPDEAAEPEETTAGASVVELRPRRPRGPRPPRSVGEWFRGSERRRRQRKRRPRTVRERVPLNNLCSAAWLGAARLAAHISVPVARTLELEAGLAGAVLEDSIAGTFIDPIAQKAAQIQGKARGVGAIVAPPVLVLAIEATQALPEERRQVRLGILLPMLEQALTVQARVADERAEAITERAEEDQQYRAAAQAKIALIFAPPPGAAEAAAAAADQAAAAAQNMAGV